MVPSAGFIRLVALVASVVLLTSRTMLLVHEFGGHGVPVRLFGGRVTGWYLFLFAGGRLSFRVAELDVGRRLVVTLGGIAIELVVGAAAFFVARRMRERAVIAFCLVCVGTVLVGHAALYLARGVHYQFGDGAFLAQRLGQARVIVVVAASALAVGVALAGGRRLARFAGALFGGTARRAASATLLVFAYRSFLSGHAMASFTAAGLMCVHHEMLPLFGGGAPDAWACAWAVSVATLTSISRLAADEHWASDVLIGAGAGWLYGYYLPELLHRCARRDGDVLTLQSFASELDHDRHGA